MWNLDLGYLLEIFVVNRPSLAGMGPVSWLEAGYSHDSLNSSMHQRMRALSTNFGGCKEYDEHF